MPATRDAARAAPPGPAARPRRRPAVLAWALLALELLVLATFPWLDHLIRQAGRPDLGTLDPFAIPPTVAGLTAGTVGAVLASRRPGHPVGWLLLAQGLVMAISAAAVGYIPYGLVARPGTLPAAHVVARIYPATIAAVLAVVGFVLLLTPTGSPPSPRWRWWTRVSAVAVAVALVAATVAPGSLDPLAQYVAGPMDPQVYGGALRVANQLALLVGILTVLAGAASLVVRFRHARGVERLQLQWVALAAALTGLSSLATGILIAVGQVNLGAWASVFGVAFLPLATGAAILRYRLYDVDRIVSRTLGYGLLTVLLGGGYALVVLALGQLLDLDALGGELLAVVDQTMQPTRASLWLRPPPGSSSG